VWCGGVPGYVRYISGIPTPKTDLLSTVTPCYNLLHYMVETSPVPFATCNTVT
jgi:hypothetical protein